MNPLSNKNAGGGPGQSPGAEHAVTMTLAFEKTALIHLASGIPTQATQLKFIQ